METQGCKSHFLVLALDGYLDNLLIYILITQAFHLIFDRPIWSSVQFYTVQSAYHINSARTTEKNDWTQW